MGHAFVVELLFAPNAINRRLLIGALLQWIGAAGGAVREGRGFAIGAALGGAVINAGLGYSAVSLAGAAMAAVGLVRY